jgi:hypothetical protein
MMGQVRKEKGFSSRLASVDPAIATIINILLKVWLGCARPVL